MGRQICFFIAESDEEEFVRFVFESNDFIVSPRNQKLTLKSILDSTYQDLSKYYIVTANSCINQFSSGIIDPTISDVIEFKRSRIEKDNKTFYWRLWAEFKYYDEDGEVILKEKWFRNKFDSYRKWIKKNYRISKDKDFYIGDGAFKLYNEGNLIPIASASYLIEF